MADDIAEYLFIKLIVRLKTEKEMFRTNGCNDFEIFLVIPY